MPMAISGAICVLARPLRRCSRQTCRRASHTTKLRPNTQSAQPLKQPSVCVIGGGPSGLACAGVLRRGGVAVSLIQESRGVGGKLCTKFAGPGGRDDPSLHFDMGVQVMRLSPGLEAALGDAVAPWPLPGRFARLKKDQVESYAATDGLVVGVPSMSSVGQQLLQWSTGQSGVSGNPQTMEVHLDRTAWVAGPALSGNGRYHVRWGRRVGNPSQIRTRPELAEDVEEEGGDFDAVVHAYEANKIVKGCRSGYKAILPAATPLVTKIAKSVRTDQVWCLMLAFEHPLPKGLTWDAATIDDHPALAWIANDSSKPQRARTPECWMAMSTRQWANQRKWTQAEAAAELTKHACALLDKMLGKSLPAVVFSKAGRWGNSTVSCTNNFKADGLEFPQMSLAVSDFSPNPVWEQGSAMGACGDWCSGFGVADAFAAGEELAARVLKDLDCAPVSTMGSKLSRKGSTDSRRPKLVQSGGVGSASVQDVRPQNVSFFISKRFTSPIPINTHRIASSSELHSLMKLLAAKIPWAEYKTTRSRRKVYGWPIVPGSDLCPLPALRRVQDQLIQIATDDAGQKIRPIQCFLCMYPDLRSTCPQHSHDWRQVTLSLGSERTMVVDDQRVSVSHGDIVILGGERHEILPSKDRSTGPRISINLFYHGPGDLCNQQDYQSD